MYSKYSEGRLENLHYNGRVGFIQVECSESVINITVAPFGRQLAV